MTPPRRGPQRQGSPRGTPPRGAPRPARTPRTSTTDRSGLGGEHVEGRRAVQELLRANRRPIKSLYMASSREDSEIVELARHRGVSIKWLRSEQFEEYARTDAHQGVLARTSPIESVAVSELFEVPHPFVVALDRITDPRNLGSIIRSAVQAGVTGFILPKHRSALITPVTTKVAAGAIEYARFATSGIAGALDIAKKHGVWSVGLDADGDADLYHLPVADAPIILVAGSEGSGLGTLVRNRCDMIAGIPMSGPLDSLNVGVATAVAVFAIARQREEHGIHG